MQRLSCGLVLLSATALAAEEACPRSVSVVGRASATQAPDFAEIAVGVEAKAATAAAALDAASKAVAGVSALARETGVAPGDIGTAAVTLRAATRTVVRPGGASTEEPDGYRAGNVVSVRLADMGRLGDLLRRALDAGANRIESVSFGLRDPAQAVAALQVAAARDALARATALAEAVGAKLGPLCTLSTAAAPPPYAMARPMAAPKVRRVPIEAGSIETSAEVTAVFAVTP